MLKTVHNVDLSQKQETNANHELILCHSYTHGQILISLRKVPVLLTDP